MHQENSKLLGWLEPVPPVVLALQHVCWAYLDMPFIQHGCWGENHWYQFPKLNPVYSTGTGGSNLFFCSFSDIKKTKQMIIRCNVLQHKINYNLAPPAHTYLKSPPCLHHPHPQLQPTSNSRHQLEHHDEEAGKMPLPMLVMLGVGRMKGTRKLTFLDGSSAVITIVVCGGGCSRCATHH